MAFEIQDRENDTLITGRNIEFVIDDENDIGEVYLDGNLIFSAQDIYSETQLRGEFKRSYEVFQAEPEDDRSDSLDVDDYQDEMESIEEDEDIDYDDPGLVESLYTPGGEYGTVEGREFIGDYHMHPKYGAMIGKFHSDRNHGRLVELDIDDVRQIREMGDDPVRAIDYTPTIEDHDEFYE
jgi:hypothetical protein